MIAAETIVIGGGPAGSTCAWKLKQAGRDVLLIDKKEFPRLKLCAGWITPKVLRDLEINPRTYPHSLVTFDKLHFHINGRQIPVKTRQYSIRRYEFDNWLLQRADVPVYNHTVRHIRRENGQYVIDDAFKCTYIVGAGGTTCPVYRTFFETANPRVASLRISTMEEELPYNYEDANCYLWFFENKLPGYSWYVPKGHGIINVGIGGKLATMKAREETIHQHWQLFTQKLHDLNLVTNHQFEHRGYNYFLRQRVQKPRIANAFITGDAAGLATKDMGEGIGPAVESGIRAANSIIHNTDYSLNPVTRFSIWNIFKLTFLKKSAI
ncbi:MAG: NAD(P)/FAD-dependent oxidoreductase [Deferribacteres bacterium]|nr:NAD(P)/FAD-dependent oxidoreductase [candidate division KSB1 bacterium]MCB9504463.1 NAD(P)/FAD-dependent oxidoreductase [Deferribacteres bacterium]